MCHKNNSSSRQTVQSSENVSLISLFMWIRLSKGLLNLHIRTRFYRFKSCPSDLKTLVSMLIDKLTSRLSFIALLNVNTLTGVYVSQSVPLHRCVWGFDFTESADFRDDLWTWRGCHGVWKVLSLQSLCGVLTEHQWEFSCRTVSMVFLHWEAGYTGGERIRCAKGHAPGVNLHWGFQAKGWRFKTLYLSDHHVSL